MYAPPLFSLRYECPLSTLVLFTLSQIRACACVTAVKASRTIAVSLYTIAALLQRTDAVLQHFTPQ